MKETCRLAHLLAFLKTLVYTQLYILLQCTILYRSKYSASHRKIMIMRNTIFVRHSFPQPSNFVSMLSSRAVGFSSRQFPTSLYLPYDLNFATSSRHGDQISLHHTPVYKSLSAC